MASRKTPIKQRSQSCYSAKVEKRTKQWNNSPKVQEKFTLVEWTSKIKKPMTSK